MTGTISRTTFVAAMAAVLCLAWGGASPAFAAQRVALVIGNATYAHVPALANPLNDAADIGGALDRLGFAVTRLENADRASLWRGLQEFALAASASEIAVVFYAGHGIEVDQRNFLVPVDARLASDQDVEFEAVPLELVSRAVERASGLRLVILDACRENPFAVQMQRAGATRSIGRGLARVEPSGETLVAYAAKEGTVASDGVGRNSPYSEALLGHLEEPGLEVGLMFRKVRDAVVGLTGGRQEPFVYGSLSSRGVYLAAGPEPEPSPVAQSPVAETPRVTATNHREDRYWDSVKDSPDPADLEAYLERYPSGTYETLARNRLKRLQDKSTDAEPSALDDASTSASDGVSVSARLEAERLAAEREFWASVKGSDDPADIRAYLDQYPGGTYEVLARNRLKRLEGTASSAEKAAAAAKAHAETDATEQSAPVSSDTAVASAPPQPASSALTLATPTPQEVESSLGLGRKERRMVQQGLASLGYEPGPVDGLFGARTRAVIGEWQSSRGEPATGHLDVSSAAVLLEAGEAAPPPNPRRIASQQAADILSEALNTAQSISDDLDRASAFGAIARAQTKTGNLQDALSIARSINDDRFRYGALSGIASAQAERGDIHGAARSFAEALSIARSIADAGTRDRAFMDIAVAQRKAGDIAGALSIARSITDADKRDWAFMDIAVAQGKAGDIAGALSTARSISNDLSRYSALGDIAPAQAQVGDIHGALSTARSIDSNSYQAPSLRAIARAQAKAGDIHGALSTARSIIPYVDTLAGAIIDIGRAQAKAGDIHGAARSFAEALDIVHEHRGSSACATALSDLARAQADAGDLQGARRSISDALNCITRTEGYILSHEVSDVAEAQAHVGDIQGALTTARSISDDFSRFYALIDIARAQAKAGDSRGALSTARSIREDAGHYRFRALQAIVEAQVELGDFPEALRIARSITKPALSVYVLSTVAEAMWAANHP